MVGGKLVRERSVAAIAPLIALGLPEYVVRTLFESLDGLRVRPDWLLAAGRHARRGCRAPPAGGPSTPKAWSASACPAAASRPYRPWSTSVGRSSARPWSRSARRSDARSAVSHGRAGRPGRGCCPALPRSRTGLVHQAGPSTYSSGWTIGALQGMTRSRPPLATARTSGPQEEHRAQRDRGNPQDPH